MQTKRDNSNNKTTIYKAP